MDFLISIDDIEILALSYREEPPPLHATETSSIPVDHEHGYGSATGFFCIIAWSFETTYKDYKVSALGFQFPLPIVWTLFSTQVTLAHTYLIYRLRRYLYFIYHFHSILQFSWSSQQNVACLMILLSLSPFPCLFDVYCERWNSVLFVFRLLNFWCSCRVYMGTTEYSKSYDCTLMLSMAC